MPSVELTTSLSVHAIDFNVGDWVTRYDSAFPGRVISVHPGINYVDVEYPTGWEREDPDELIVLPVFHDSLGTTKHNVLLLGKLNQNLRQRSHKFGSSDPVMTREDHLNALVLAYHSSNDRRKKKIATFLTNNFSVKDISNVISHQKRVAKVATKKKT